MSTIRKNNLFIATIILLSSNLSLANTTSAFECITYFKKEVNNGEVTYLSDVKFISLLSIGDTQVVNKKNNDIDISLYLKAIDKNNILIVDQENRLNSPNPEFISDLSKYSYVEQSSTLIFNEEDGFSSLRALCFKSEHVSSVPFLKNFKYMVDNKIDSLEEIQFLNSK